MVSPDNFVRADTDLYFANIVKDGGFGKLKHNRELSPLDNQLVVLQNRDTLYSAAVFDFDAGPVTVTLPDAGTRFMSMQVIDQDEYTHDVIYSKGLHTFTRPGRNALRRPRGAHPGGPPPTSPTSTPCRTRSSSRRTRPAASK
jgi:hypothetical protein